MLRLDVVIELSIPLSRRVFSANAMLFVLLRFAPEDESIIANVLIARQGAK